MTRIYTAFSTSGVMGECQVFTAYHPDRKIISNEEILKELKARTTDVKFVGGADPITKEQLVAAVKAQKETLDGILLFGTPVDPHAPEEVWLPEPPDELISIGLPIVNVYPFWGQWMYPFHAYKGEKVVTSFLPVIPDNNRATFSSRLDDIAEKIKLIQAVSKMKNLRVLVITDNPMLGEYWPWSWQVEGNRRRYEEEYLYNLREVFGTELVVIPQREMVDKMNNASEQDAKRIARRWIEEAAGMRGTNEIEVIKSAKLYLAMKELMELHNCQAITTEGYIVFQYYREGPIPSQGLPSSQFCTDGVVATSETLIDSLITQQLGLFITGSTGFNGDYLIDPFNNVAILGHCESPLNPYGDDRKASYVIRNLPLWEENKGGACVQVDLPIGETVTVAKISVHDKKIALFTGESVSGEELFAGWDDILCRTKLPIRTNAEALFHNLDWKTFGNHRVAFYGNHRGEFKELASLIGFDVVEDDLESSLNP